jgi:transposase
VGRQRRRFDAAFKAKVAVAALREQETTAQIGGRLGVHPNQVAKWKKVVLGRLHELFGSDVRESDRGQKELVDSLYQQIGKLQFELEWLKKTTERLS